MECARAYVGVRRVASSHRRHFQKILRLPRRVLIGFGKDDPMRIILRIEKYEFWRAFHKGIRSGAGILTAMTLQKNGGLGGPVFPYLRTWVNSDNLKRI